MAEEKYVIPENPQYSEVLRKIQDTDPVSASRIVNPLIQKMIENIAAVKRDQDNIAGEAITKMLPLLEKVAARVVSLEKTVNGLEKLTGGEDPAAGTAAQVGQVYINIQTGEEWKCVAAGETGTVWEKLEGSTVGLTAADVGAKPSTWVPFAAQAAAPEDTSVLWIDTTATTGGLKYFNGSAWVHVPVAYTS